jgi:SAM-dependent methyltransferase
VSDSDSVDRQRRFYDTREHAHLQVQTDDFYASKLAHRMVDALGIRDSDRVLEVGAGFGRFTFPLLERCAEVVALDLSRVALEKLEARRDALGVDRRRLTTFCGNLDGVGAGELGQRFDFVVGFFLLHHLPDVAGSIEQLASVLSSGGRIGFLEPNRRNPLFLAQLAACADMTWAQERGMFRLSRGHVEDAYRRAGLEVLDTGNFGFFPPQVLNPLPFARRIEERLESLAVLQWVLPFLILTARAPEEGAG